MADGDAGVLPKFLNSVAKLRVRLNSATTDIGARQRINLLDSATITWNLVDSPVNEEVTLTATGAAASTVGTLGYTPITTTQSGIGNSVTDLTNLTVTVTVGAGRRIKVTGYVNFVNGGTAGVVLFFIRESSTTLQEVDWNVVANAAVSPHITVILTPSTGSHTYKLSAQLTGGGTMSTSAASTEPLFILVEDIGT